MGLLEETYFLYFSNDLLKVRDLLNAAGAVDRGGPDKTAVTENSSKVTQLANDINNNNNNNSSSSSMTKEMKEDNRNSTGLVVNESGKKIKVKKVKVTVDAEKETKTSIENTKTPQVIVKSKVLGNDSVTMLLQEIFKELVEGRERPAITLEPVTELTLEADPTLEYVIDDDDYYYFDEYNMVDQDDRLAAINYQVTMTMVIRKSSCQVK